MPNVVVTRKLETIILLTQIAYPMHSIRFRGIRPSSHLKQIWYFKTPKALFIQESWTLAISAHTNYSTSHRNVYLDKMADTTDNTTHSALEDKAIEQAQKGRGASGRGRGGRSGGQGREVQISKALSRLLRHQAENAGITLDSEGYAPLDRVVSPWLEVRMRACLLGRIISLPSSLHGSNMVRS
jgi:hypothetical protein